MEQAHLRKKKRGAFRTGLLTRAWIFTMVILVSWVVSGASAQTEPYYEYDNYNPAQPYKSGILGTLFNSSPYLIKDAQTAYNGLQDVWATAYLPFAVQEHNANIPLALYGSHYTTGIALCSPKNPVLNLYAPIQVSALANAIEPSIEMFAFATDIPAGGVPLNFKGPFNGLRQLNIKDNVNINAASSAYGISILSAAQKFTQFSHELLTDKNGVGWNGSDKDGILPIKFSIVQGVIPPFTSAGFFPDLWSNGEIAIPTSPHDLFVTRVTVGHEIAHAIIMNVDGFEINEQYSTTRKEINEGFADIIGHSFRLWMTPEKFTSLDWVVEKEVAFPGEGALMIDNPKKLSHPTTYLGDYYQTDPAQPNYNVHHNGTVLEYWFTLINDGKIGYVDGKFQRGPFIVKPLVPGNSDATYKLALRILFNAFTTKLTPTANYIVLREAIAAAAIDLGYLPGSHVYDQLENAWIAVGVGSFNFKNICVETSAASLGNGNLDFNGQRSYIGPNILSPKVTTLVDCSDADTIETLTSEKVPFADWDEDNIYSDNYNDQKSKMAVSIHAFSQLAKKWFKQRLGYAGHKLTNVLEESAVVTSIFEKGPANSATFYYSNQNLSACRDKISLNYFQAVNEFIQAPGNGNPPYSSEHKTIETSVGQIFSLEIKKDYERSKQNPEAEHIWTIFEEMSDPLLIKDFAKPKLFGQPALYQGANWIANDPEHNTGFLNFFYYLLTHGTVDENGQDNGYTDPELGNKVYFVNAMDRNLVLRVLWDAYKAVPENAGIEEFRQMTMTVLHQLDPIKYHAKSKEYIAFFDAWAAVLGFGDYASNLKHSPEDGASVYPWTVRVGVEVEYPLYESYRLFEVSKSATFNESEHPVHRFVSDGSPNLTTGMTFGDINLEPGQFYKIRSRLADGENSRQFCAGTDDPHFCESLLTKKKWTITYDFETKEVAAPVTISPAKGQIIDAWASPFSFGSIEGARGYDIHVIDPVVTAAEHDFPVDIAFDEDNISKPVNTVLALSKDAPYSYNVAARQRLGSEWAVHVLPNGMVTLLTEAEKEQFPNTYGKWNEVMDFKTNIPTIKLHSPANGTHVPIFGEDITVRAKKEFPELADYYQYSFREPLYTDKAVEDEPGFAHYPIGVQGLIGLENLKSYEWTFIQRKKATLPFIPVEEEGASPGWFTFIVDKDLAAKPEVENIDCVEAGSQVTLQWKEVPGAQTYKVTGINATTQTEIGSFQTGQLGAKIDNMSAYPNKYVYKVAAGVMGGNGEWIFGPEAIGDYSVLAPSPSNLSPNNVDDVQLGNSNSVVLSWNLPAGVTTVQLMAKVDGAPQELINQPVTGTSFTLNNLDFNSPIFWTVTPLAENSCAPQAITGFFNTEKDPVVQELGFGFNIVSKVAQGFAGPQILYNITIRDPDGNIVHTKATAEANFTWVEGKLPLMDGIYTADIILSKVDPFYTKSSEYEVGYYLITELSDQANGSQIDIDEQANFFEPVTNMTIKLKFVVNTSNQTIGH